MLGKKSILNAWKTIFEILGHEAVYFNTLGTKIGGIDQ